MTHDASGTPQVASSTPQVASDTPQVSPTQRTGRRLRELHDNAGRTPEEVLEDQ